MSESEEPANAADRGRAPEDQPVRQRAQQARDGLEAAHSDAARRRPRARRLREAPAAPTPFCLPVEYASHNLLPEVRDGAIDLFKELDIPWHDSVAGGPSNHLRDSQVQCVNALFAMVADAERIKLAFGGAVDIAEVLPIEDGRFLTFEYIGPTDYFGEGIRDGKDVGRRRGTNCTSVDAAFLYKTSSRRNRAGAGRVEVHRVLPRRKERNADFRRRPDRSVRR